MFVISVSGYGETFYKKTLLNSITNSTHHPVAVGDIFDCTGNMEGANTNNSKFISNCMKVMMDEIDPRKKLSDLINFDDAKVVQVSGELLEVYRTNLNCMLWNLYSGNI